MSSPESPSEKWQNFITQSEIHASQSKPEYLAIVDILKPQESLKFTQILDDLHLYTPEITERQLRYILKSMVESNLIVEESGEYYVETIEEKAKSQISTLQVAFLLFSIVAIPFSSHFFYVSLGIVAVLIIQQLEHTIYFKKNL